MLDKLLNLVVNTPTEEEEQEFINYVNDLHIYAEPEEKALCFSYEHCNQCYRFAEVMLNHAPLEYYISKGYKVLTFKEFKEQYMFYMEGKELKIIPPTGFIVDEENSTFECIKFKPKKLTYEDVAEKLFSDTQPYFITTDGCIQQSIDLLRNGLKDPNNCYTKEQAKKLLAINKFINVAIYLNKEGKECEYIIYLVDNCIKVGAPLACYGMPKFKSKEDAEQV